MAGRHGLWKLDHSTPKWEHGSFKCGRDWTKRSEGNHGVPLRQPRKTVAGFGLHPQVLLFRKHFVLSIAAADDVGDQIQDLVFRHAIEQALGHW
ncbi:hypothetical protein Fuma_01575 [Fuerstiella marisgermanici]|uniref:Uncharacterized protein n=1 Tax=Fuerstiella marisgermanici TaxID=1891926 RepID=A0A1P8WD54_9PLAN|nr:hypothetical protein Fuma_01575 [Fuerstiella marisgermanici]